MVSIFFCLTWNFAFWKTRGCRTQILHSRFQFFFPKCIHKVILFPNISFSFSFFFAKNIAFWKIRECAFLKRDNSFFSKFKLKNTEKKYFQCKIQNFPVCMKLCMRLISLKAKFIKTNISKFCNYNRILCFAEDIRWKTFSFTKSQSKWVVIFLSR